MHNKPVIALLTDFGSRDWFVSAMKGVILTIAPHSRIIDISHHVAPGDIHSAAFSLMAVRDSFPPNAIFVVVVDPGVGSERRALAARAGDYLFIGPDNGVLSFAFRRQKPLDVYAADNVDYYRKTVSATFHGRDIFAPLGAHLANNVDISSLGSSCFDFISLPWPAPREEKEAIYAEIIYIDHFGNAFTSITGEMLARQGRTPRALTVSEHHIIPIKRYYQQQLEGALLAVVNSAGYLEVAINGGNAAETLGLSIGSPVVLLRNAD